MMKRIVPLLLFACCFPVAIADYDRLIGSSEYVWGLNWPSGLLVIDGGGASN